MQVNLYELLQDIERASRGYSDNMRDMGGEWLDDYEIDNDLGMSRNEYDSIQEFKDTINVIMANASEAGVKEDCIDVTSLNEMALILSIRSLADKVSSMVREREAIRAAAVEERSRKKRK